MPLSGKKHFMSILSELFLTFAKIGLFTFGGGYAMIALIEDACAEKKQWISHDEMMDVTVIAESTPGPIAINCATYVGFKQKGFSGAIAATLGIIFPSFCIIFAVSCYLENFLEIRWIAGAFKGIQAAVGILILDAGIRMIQKMPKKQMPLCIAAVSALCILLSNVFSWKLSSIAVMAAGGLVSLSLFMMKNSRKGGERT